MLIRHHMSTDLVTVNLDTQVRWARQLMREYNISRLPVINDDGALVGLLTEHVLVEACERLHGQLADERVKDIMIVGPITVGPNDSIASALKLFDEDVTDVLIVVENHKPVGIMTRGDVISVMCKLLGLDRPGCCIEAALIEDKNDLAKAFAILSTSEVEIISVVFGSVRDDGDEPSLYVRIGHPNPRSVERLLAQAGFILLKPENTPHDIIRRRDPHHVPD